MAPSLVEELALASVSDPLKSGARVPAPGCEVSRRAQSALLNQRRQMPAPSLVEELALASVSEPLKPALGADPADISTGSMSGARVPAPGCEGEKK